MRILPRVLGTCAAVTLIASAAPVAAAPRPVPEWARPAVRYLADKGLVDRDTFRPNRPMLRADFKVLMRRAFGGGYRRAKGDVRAREVSRALVRALGKAGAARALRSAAATDGWSPHTSKWFGFEIVAREMGLRHDRPSSEERFEASAGMKMAQADVAFAVWKALTSPGLRNADALTSFRYGNLDGTRKKVVQYAVSQVGRPYVWGGEWPRPTPSGYPYGTQVAGGFDCSGFVWYVLRRKEPSWDPINRPYRGWALPERSSAEMAKATPAAGRLGYRRLRPGDVVLFAPNGSSSRPADVYHAGLYVGKGWMIHSSGSRAGVSVASLAPGTWWHSQIIFGRRVIPS